MPIEMQNEIEIARSPREVYDYVTQPWRWHEWHPSSRSASADTDMLAVGDGFDELVEVRPLPPLPIKLMRSTRYTVEIAEPGVVWQVKGDMADAWLRIHYDFHKTATGTRFERTLTFEVRGLTRLWLPMLKRQTVRLSAQALANLRDKLEASS